MQLPLTMADGSPRFSQSRGRCQRCRGQRWLCLFPGFSEGLPFPAAGSAGRIIYGFVSELLILEPFQPPLPSPRTAVPRKPTSQDRIQLLAGPSPSPASLAVLPLRDLDPACDELVCVLSCDRAQQVAGTGGAGSCSRFRMLRCSSRVGSAG